MSRAHDALVLQCDLKLAINDERDELDAAIRRVLDSGHLILGGEVTAFEREFADYLGVPHVLGVASGTDAIFLSLKALDIGNGDAVFTVSHTAVATVAAIEATGATPVLIDISPETYTIDTERLAAGIKKIRESHPTLKLRAVIAVHLYGSPCNLDALEKICKENHLDLIEDCAQATGAKYREKRVGSFGRCAAFSFYPTKNLGALGDGGAIATQDSSVFEKLKKLRQYGWKERYVSEIAGYNSRLDEIQAAILRVRLRSLDRNNERRKAAARQYRDALSSATGTHSSRFLPTLPHLNPSNADSVFHLYVIQTETSTDRDVVIEQLRRNGIQTAIHYPSPVHLQPAYRSRLELWIPEALSQTEKVCSRILSLPIYPQIPTGHIERVARAILERP